MTTFRKPFKPLPEARDCPVCQGRYITAEDVKRHNLNCADYGERQYRGPRQ